MAWCLVHPPPPTTAPGGRGREQGAEGRKCTDSGQVGHTPKAPHGFAVCYPFGGRGGERFEPKVVKCVRLEEVGIEVFVISLHYCP